MGLKKRLRIDARVDRRGFIRIESPIHPFSLEG
jgi:hypothetical protein